MTLNGVMAVILRHFSEFGKLAGALRRSSRSLSHLLMSCCLRMFDMNSKSYNIMALLEKYKCNSTQTASFLDWY